MQSCGAFCLNPICCCCCQVTSVVSDSVRPHRWQPTRLLCPWDSPGKNTGVGCHFLLQCMHACMLSCFSHVRLSATVWTASHQAPLSTGFSKQEYWSGLPCPSPIISTIIYYKDNRKYTFVGSISASQLLLLNIMYVFRIVVKLGKMVSSLFPHKP